MEKHEAALGAGKPGVSTCLAVDPANLSPEERIHMLEEQMRHLLKVITTLKKRRYSAPAAAAKSTPVENANKDGIPIGTTCFGGTEKSPFIYYLTVEEDGYVVGGQKFASLSAAAETVSQVRRSGLTFWRMLNGKTLKEVFRP
jgi:hypothetical protein